VTCVAPTIPTTINASTKNADTSLIAPVVIRPPQQLGRRSRQCVPRHGDEQRRQHEHRDPGTRAETGPDGHSDDSQNERRQEGQQRLDAAAFAGHEQDAHEHAKDGRGGDLAPRGDHARHETSREQRHSSDA
jgi:hypothetical protein